MVADSYHPLPRDKARVSRRSCSSSSAVEHHESHDSSASSSEVGPMTRARAARLQKKIGTWSTAVGMTPPARLSEAVCPAHMLLPMPPQF